MIIRSNLLFNGLFFYFLTGLLMYLYGPIDWKEDDPVEITLYLAFTFILMYLAWLFGYSTKVRVQLDSTLSGNIYVFFLFAVIYINLKIYVFTGDFFTNIDFSANTFDSYLETVQYSLQRESSMASMMASLGTVLFVFFFWGFLYKIIFAGHISKVRYLLLIILGFFYFSLIVAKGSDKEILDLFVFTLAALYLKGKIRFTLKRVTYVSSFLLLLLFIVFLRKEARIFDDECFYLYCTYDSVESSFYRAFVSFSGYLSQGYKGLSVALSSDLSSAPGLCVSPMLSSFSNRLFGLCSDYGPYVNYINESGLWTSKGNWVSSFVWLSNFLGFIGTSLLYIYHAFIFGFAIRILKRSFNFLVLVFVFYSLIIYIYISANNQVFLSLDSAFLFTVSFIYVSYLFFRRRVL